MIDIPTLRADDTEEFEVILERREGDVSVTLRVDGADMILLLSQSRLNVITDALLTYRKSKERVEVFSAVDIQKELDISEAIDNTCC
jgi:hypothetical protein